MPVFLPCSGQPQTTPKAKKQNFLYWYKCSGDFYETTEGSHWESIHANKNLDNDERAQKKKVWKAASPQWASYTGVKQIVISRFKETEQVLHYRGTNLEGENDDKNH